MDRRFGLLVLPTVVLFGAVPALPAFAQQGGQQSAQSSQSGMRGADTDTGIRDEAGARSDSDWSSDQWDFRGTKRGSADWGGQSGRIEGGPTGRIDRDYRTDRDDYSTYGYDSDRRGGTYRGDTYRGETYRGDIYRGDDQNRLRVYRDRSDTYKSDSSRADTYRSDLNEGRMRYDARGGADLYDDYDTYGYGDSLYDDEYRDYDTSRDRDYRDQTFSDDQRGYGYNDYGSFDEYEFDGPRTRSYETHSGLSRDFDDFQFESDYEEEYYSDDWYDNNSAINSWFD